MKEATKIVDDDTRNYVCGFCGSEITETEEIHCRDLKQRRGYFRARVTDLSRDTLGLSGYCDTLTFLLIDSGKVVKRGFQQSAKGERLLRGQEDYNTFLESIGPIKTPPGSGWKTWCDCIIGRELVLELRLSAQVKVMGFYPIEEWGH